MANEKILFIGPHPDDIDLGCAICMHDYHLKNHKIKTIVLTKGEKGNGNMPSNRVLEEYNAFKILAPEAENTFLDFPDTKLLYHINEIVAEIRKIVMNDIPDIVFIPSGHDFHQDHVVTFESAMAVFNHIRVRGIICYETPSTMPNFSPNYFKVCSPESFGIKAKAIQCHESQAEKSYVSYETIYSIAKMRAIQGPYHEAVAEAVAGIPGSDLNNIRFFGKVRASVKIFFATFRKCGGEIISGGPFCISGSVGMYKTQVLRSVRFPNRTCVEDMDLTWELISRGYKVVQSSKAIVFSQEAATLSDNIKRWRRWISGYAACMRIHKGLLLKRFGLTTILPCFFIGLFGIILFVMPFVSGYMDALEGTALWLSVLIFASGYSAYKEGKKWWLMLYLPFSIFIIVLVFFSWALWGLPTLVTGNQELWRKVKRY